jgi:hypothetical protein
MKLSLIGVVALTLLTAAPALAQMRDDHNNQRQMQQQHNGPQQRMGGHQGQSWHEGQNYHGHRLHNHNGHWGYYQPHNGTQLFINIPL